MDHSSPGASAPIPTPPPQRPRAPLAGIVAAVVLVAGLGAWTLQRIAEARTLQTDVDARRAAESERAAAVAQEPPLVRVVRGAPEVWRAHIDLDGTLEPEQQAALGFKVAGRLARVAVKVGDRVRAGTVLAELDRDEAAAQLTAAEAQTRSAEASLALARDAEERTLPLVRGGSFAEESAVQVTSQRELAAAALDGARAELALARAGLQSHTLTAPFSGTITRAPNGIGGVVSPGQALFELVDTSRLKLSTTVGEDDANLLVEGAVIEIATESGPVSGRIDAILGMLDPRTRRVPVVAAFEAPAGGPTRLRAGSFVRARAAAEREVPVLRLPHAVLRPGSQNELFVVSAQGSALELRRVVHAVAPDGSLLVRRGVDARDQVVVSPIAEARAGDVVRVAAPAAPGERAVPEEPAAGGAP